MDLKLKPLTFDYLAKRLEGFRHQVSGQLAPCFLLVRANPACLYLDSANEQEQQNTTPLEKCAVCPIETLQVPEKPKRSNRLLVRKTDGTGNTLGTWSPPWTGIECIFEERLKAMRKGGGVWGSRKYLNADVLRMLLVDAKASVE